MYTWLELLRSSVLISLVSLAAAQGVPRDASFEDEFSALLSNVVFENGLVDYDKIRSQQAVLDAILDKIANFDGPLDTDDRKKSFWINAYNANMLNMIAAHPRVKNIVDDGYADTFFKLPIRRIYLRILLSLLWTRGYMLDLIVRLSHAPHCHKRRSLLTTLIRYSTTG